MIDLNNIDEIEKYSRKNNTIDITIADLNELTIDQLLNCRKHDIKFNVTRDVFIDETNLRWKNSYLDISDELISEVIFTIKALMLKESIYNSENLIGDIVKQNQDRLYGSLAKEVDDLTAIANTNKKKNVLHSIFDELRKSPDDKDEDILDDLEEDDLSFPKTFKERYEYIIDLLSIKDLTDKVFVMLAISASNK